LLAQWRTSSESLQPDNPKAWPLDVGGQQWQWEKHLILLNRWLASTTVGIHHMQKACCACFSKS
jgi:hypothetical protein